MSKYSGAYGKAKGGSEHDNGFAAGKSGGKVPVKMGPAYGGGSKSNPRKGGGINRATTG